MKNSTALAYVNFYAAMGTLHAFCEYSAEAKALAAKQNIAIRFKITDGPDGVLTFRDGAVTAKPYAPGTPFQIGLAFKSCDQFNNMVAGGNELPLPFRGLTRLGFVTKKDSNFNVLVDKMTALMRGTDTTNTDPILPLILKFNAMASAIVQIGNYEPKGQVARKNWPDGDATLSIPGVAEISINKSNGVLTLLDAPSPNPRAMLIFKDADVASGIIDGELDAMTCIGTGEIMMKGMGFILDNLNKCLNIVPDYLA